MKVKFRTVVSDGSGRRYNSGEVADVDDAQAKTWLGHGLVETVESDGKATKRTATKQAPRTATTK